jgi:hypothetical protein
MGKKGIKKRGGKISIGRINIWLFKNPKFVDVCEQQTTYQ